MKIVATSDAHGSLPEIPDCDLLLMAGDICPVRGSHAPHVQQQWLENTYFPWLDEQPAKHILWIAGNHDFVCEREEFRTWVEDEDPGRYLQDESVEIEGLKIYGMPWCANLRNWAFYSPDDNFKARAEAIPSDTDIVLMHSPPRWIYGLDGGHPEWSIPYVASRLEEIQPKLVVFGHIHEGYGKRKIDDTQYVNAAHMDEFYEPINPPMEFEI